MDIDMAENEESKLRTYDDLAPGEKEAIREEMIEYLVEQMLANRKFLGPADVKREIQAKFKIDLTKVDAFNILGSARARFIKRLPPPSPAPSKDELEGWWKGSSKRYWLKKGW